ncbi:hypothetical protein GCK72_006221 [Caenorhabditis remanei]|uniref:Uncharacterized protein n=1 Tax=Caenorhabditis remanei TaxID=31234 RepID=A0A6A5HFP9_CAERE|nr:hypothetical protein GCK72_006221 [Caenorhabditis remanei]KAF1766265.1 hypothetical protein GCK72_006221 [Caenorhabditis remanei]
MGCTRLASSCDEPYRLPGTIHGGIAWQLRLECVAGNSQKNGFLWVENSTWWINSESLHVGRLDSISDAASRRVDHLDVVGVLVIIRSVEDDFGVWLGLDVSWWDGLSHGKLVEGVENSVEFMAIPPAIYAFSYQHPRSLLQIS